MQKTVTVESTDIPKTTKEISNSTTSSAEETTITQSQETIDDSPPK